MKQILLSQGAKALVDDEDYAYLNKWKWHKTAQGYAGRSEHWREADGSRKGTVILMHRVVKLARKGEMIDHEDENPLNNQRSNLRLCTKGQNGANSSKVKAKSGYKGVYLHKLSGLYMAKVADQYLGYFKSSKEAAKAYNNKAVELYGEFARLNNVT